MILVLKILGGLLALALGVWFGLPGRYSQTAEEIEESMARGPGRRKKVKRHFTPMAWLQRNVKVRTSRGAGSRRARGFRVDLPDE